MEGLTPKTVTELQMPERLFMILQILEDLR